jgi:hypothetical protein
VPAVAQDFLSTDATGAFQEADKNQDGVVSQEEFNMWMSKNAVLNRNVSGGEDELPGAGAEPTDTQLKHLFYRSALPFVGFGFLDNAIMICAGDMIESTLGATLCLSTMAAAGLGNLVSDIAGLGAGGAWLSLPLKLTRLSC